MGDATSSNFRDKDPSVLPADDGDAQRLRTFVHNDIAGFLQVRPGGKEKAYKMNSIQEKRVTGYEAGSSWEGVVMDWPTYLQLWRVSCYPGFCFKIVSGQNYKNHQ